MSSTGTARAKSSTRKKYEEYAKRPDGEESNTGIPRYGYYVQHALYPSLAIVLRTLRSLDPVELPNERGAVIRNASNSTIATATAKFTGGLPMALRTVGHCLDALAQRGIAIPWDVDGPPRATHSPFGRSWRLPRYREILDRWAAAEHIFTVGNCAFYVRGKGRRFMSPAEVVAWGMDHAAAEKCRAMHAQAADADEPLSAREMALSAEESDMIAVHAAISGPITMHGTGGEYELPGIDAEPAHAQKILKAAREAVPGMPASGVAEAVRSIRLDKHAADRKNTRQAPWITAGWVLSKITAAAHGWRLAQRDRATA